MRLLQLFHFRDYVLGMHGKRKWKKAISKMLRKGANLHKLSITYISQR